jgi:hypothetical protein
MPIFKVIEGSRAAKMAREILCPHLQSLYVFDSKHGKAK